MVGAWPIRDFVDPDMPLTYAVSAAVQWLLDPGLHPELVLMCVLFTALTILTAVAAPSSSRPL